ncbi:hypothetical protein B0H34DRAFT_674636 [Crassisporium funariophilum]|nr:hypothetical protein B0H34DRAFT_674636 [Crassisporium funariophilum]
MLLLAGLLLRVLAFGTQVAPAAASLKFNFTDVAQCEPVMISFDGSNTTEVPNSLSIIPFNSTAIVVPLPNPAIIYSGIAITFLPFAAGSNYIASLDDASGDNIIKVSDIIRVLPSSTGNSSCVSVPDANARRRYTLASSVSQCEEIMIQYDTTVVSQAPTVRLFNPKGSSFLLNLTRDEPDLGEARYLMNFSRGKEIVLLMDDGSTIRETTPLLTVGGDAASSKDCLQSNSSSTKTDDNTNVAKSDSPIASKAVIIGSAAGGGAVVMIGICMAIFIVRDRRRRRENQHSQFDPSRLERAPEPSSDEKNEKSSPRQLVFVEPPQRSSSNGVVVNPIYTSNSFLSPTKSTHMRGSMASWAQVIPEDQKYPASPVSLSQVAVQRPRSADRISIQSLDIEGMLNMATLQSEGPSRKNSEPLGFGSTIPYQPVTTPVPTMLRPETSRRHLRDPSDVPADLHSLISSYSVNPFDGRTSMTEPTEPSLSRGDSATLRPPTVAVGLPASPRDGARVNQINGKPASGRSSRSSSDWYGIAR